LPSGRPPPSLSMNSRTMPTATKRKATQCSSRARSLRIQAPMTAVNTGPIYCSRMALAALVVLLAETKSSMVAAWARAAPTWGSDQWNLGRRSQARTTSEEIRLRAPAMAKGFQSMTLMNKPALLHRKAVAAMAQMPRRISRSLGLTVISLIKIISKTKIPNHTFLNFSFVGV